MFVATNVHEREGKGEKMPSIMNKEEAERVKEIAKVHWKNKNHDRAVRLFQKSLQLYPLPSLNSQCQCPHARQLTSQ